MALIASGPVGWIAGAVLGGLVLVKGKNVIKDTLSFLGLGINKEKIRKELGQVRENFGNQVESNISSKIKDIKSKLIDLNYKIAESLAKKIK